MIDGGCGCQRQADTVRVADAPIRERPGQLRGVEELRCLPPGRLQIGGEDRSQERDQVQYAGRGGLGWEEALRGVQAIGYRQDKRCSSWCSIMYATDIYDCRLREMDHYRRYPEMLPFVGNDYNDPSHGKLLLIAESHYLPEYSHAHNDAAGWYDGSSATLDKEERSWINTRAIVNSGKNQKWSSRAKIIFRRIEDELLNAGFPRRENMFVHVAFMNCFLRPAKTGLSISEMLTPEDVQKSAEAVNHVLAVLKPDRVCFISSVAWKYVGQLTNRPGMMRQHTPHPACQWWYRTSKRGTGSELFRVFARGCLAARS